MINDNGDAAKEVNKRISECNLTWKRLETFWKKGNLTTRDTLVVYDALIRSKLMY